MKYERDYFIHYYDADLKLRLDVTSLMRYFEDIAILQSESRGIGLKYYAENNVAWVLYKWDIEIEEYPMFGDTVRVVTEPIGFYRYYAYRTFDVYNSAGNKIISARSVWLFVDTKNRRPMKINEDMYRGYQITRPEEKAYDIEDIHDLREEQLKREFFVRQSDIDTNGHVNNIKYVDWALEVLPADIQRDYVIRRLMITYKKETHYGNKISTAAEYSDYTDKSACSIHRIEDGGNTLCQMKISWQKPVE